MKTAETPIKTQIIKERAARKLGESKKISSIKQASQIRVTGSMVKPIHVSKSDPLVKRITQYIT